MRIRILGLVSGLVLAVFAFLGAGCASTPRPGTGDIAFRLYWQGEEDLDLHVQEPSGAAIYFQSRKAESGGELDLDCNSAADRICRTPVENVYWPVGKAAEGDYTYWVELFQHSGQQLTVPFTLQVLLGKQVVHSEKGTMSVTASASPKFHFSYRHDPTGRPAAGLAARRSPGSGSSRP
jgi:hypothetical protein